MYYSLIGILAIVIQLIINHDMLWRCSEHTVVPARREYRDYIFGMLVFCVTDMLWGFFNECRLALPLYADTVMFFLTMTLGFLLWTRYIVVYMNDKNTLRTAISIAGIAMFVCVVVMLAVNFFVPILFTVDGDGVYHAGVARYVTLVLQVILFMMVSVYTFVAKAKNELAAKRLRRTVVLSGAGMAALIVVQMYYPMMPLYSMGFLFSSSLLHSFVVEDEKEEQRRELEETLRREQEQIRELGSAKKKIYTDPLTGVKSKQAYIEDEEKLNKKIRSGLVKELGVVVFDVNDLKSVNDNLGHDTGDIYIYTASMMISEFFENSPVYRIGGDEFAVILEGGDYGNREKLLAAFDHQSEENQRSGKVVVASGMAVFKKESDRKIRDIFERADRQMYLRKSELKKLHRQEESVNE